jgi:hypothetical protein
MPMKQASGAIRPWGVIRVLPVKGPEEAPLIPEPCDKQNVSLENVAVKLFVEAE